MERTSSKNVVLLVVLLFIIVISVFGITLAFFNYSRTSTKENSIRAGTIKFGYTEEANGISLTNALPISDDTALKTENESDYFDFHIVYDIQANATLNYEIDIEDITDDTLKKLNASTENGLEEVEGLPKEYTRLLSSRIKVALLDMTADTDDSGQSSQVVKPTYFSELEKGKDNVVEASNDGEKKVYKLYSSSLPGKADGTTNGVKKYRLYMWIPEKDDQSKDIPLVDIDGAKGIQKQTFSVKINVKAENALVVAENGKE